MLTLTTCSISYQEFTSTEKILFLLFTIMITVINKNKEKEKTNLQINKRTSKSNLHPQYIRPNSLHC